MLTALGTAPAGLQPADFFARLVCGGCDEQCTLWAFQRVGKAPHSHEKQARIRRTKEQGCVEPLFKHQEAGCIFLEYFPESKSISATLSATALG